MADAAGRRKPWPWNRPPGRCMDEMMMIQVWRSHPLYSYRHALLW
jgi:hypothetical protein